MSVDRFRVSGHFAISAGAGTGKTYTLSRRYMNCLVGFDLFSETGTPGGFDQTAAESRMAEPYDIITITYTEAGAAEMRRRIEELLSGVLKALSGSADAEQALTAITDKLSADAGAWLADRLTYCRSGLVHARIGTIHSFALEHLRRNADFFNWDASPRIVDPIEQSVLLRKHLNDALAEQETDARRLFRIISKDDVFDIAESYVGDAVFRTRFNEFSGQEYLPSTMLRLFWRHQLTTNWEHIVRAAVELPGLRAVTSNEEKYEEHVGMMHDVFAWFANPVGNRPDFPGIVPIPRKDEGAKQARQPYYESFEVLKKLTLDFDDKTETLFTQSLDILRDVLKNTYESAMAQLRLEAMVDFDFIINACHELVVDRGITPQVKHLMVDEFQDTNETQWTIIKTIAESAKSAVFLVGDEKQSIYSFQGAEVAVFKRALSDMGIPATPMTGNYRSKAAIIDFVNACFSGLFNKPAPADPVCADPVLQTHLAAMHRQLIDRTGLAYEPLDVMRNEATDGTVTLLAPDMFMDTGSAGKEYAAVASLVSRIHMGQIDEFSDITEKMNRDDEAVAILLHTRKEAADMTKALNEAGIRATLRTTESIYETPTAIELHHFLAVLSALATADSFTRLPRFHLAGALRGSYLRLTDEEVVRIMTDKDHDAVHALFAPVMPLVDILPLPRLIARIIEHFSLRQVYATLEDDRQRLADLDKLTTLAHGFVEREGAGLAEFVRHLEHAIYAEVPPDEAQEITDTAGRNAVWCMTVHAAKGLQYPMVILPRIGKNLTQRQKTEKVQKVKESIDGEMRSLFGFSVNGETPAARMAAKEFANDQHIDERIRLLYVAMTRAEDHLVLVCPAGNRNTESYRAYLDARFGHDLKDLGEGEAFSPEDPSDTDHRFAPSPINGTRMLSVRPATPTGSFRALREIVDITTPPLPDFGAADTVTAAVRQRDATIHEEATRLGTAFHELVERHFHAMDDAKARQNAATRIAEIHELDDAQTERLKGMGDAFAASQLYADIAAAEEVQFELPTAVILPDGTKGFGRIDVVYGDDSGYTVIDFKTTADAEANISESYAAQVRLYAESVENRTGIPVTGAVAFVHETGVRTVDADTGY